VTIFSASGSVSPPLVLCATRRLARSLQLGAPAADGRVLPAFTMAGWLDALFDEALLRGELPAADVAVRVLSPLQERILWRQVIARALGKDGTAALFDLDGLAAAAQDAHALMETWGLSAAAVQAGGHDEASRFLQWRHAFLRLCDNRAWRDAARQTRWRVAKLAEGVGRLPQQIELAGFDRFNPGEQNLLAVLAQRGVEIRHRPLGQTPPQGLETVSFADADSEYRALAEWLRTQLAANPNARLGVVVPDLAGARALLTRRLDEAIAPEAFSAQHAQAVRRYNLSLGNPLNAVPPVEVALNLLRLATQPRRVEQAMLGGLLLAPYWSAEQGEAEARARLDAECRKRLPAVLSLERWLQFAETRLAKGLPISRTLRHLDGLRKAATVGGKGKRLPGVWAEQFRGWLRIAGWPGERALSSHDFQAREAFFDVLDGLAEFDAIVGEQSIGEALSLLNDACAEVLFQPKTEGAPPVQVLGLLEAAGESFDALWVSGMLANAWPPPARPNPLLPAALQRAVGTPNASPEVQLVFASGVHQRFLQAAPAVVFSWPRMDGERELQPSPLLAGMPPAARPLVVPVLNLELLRQAAGESLEWLVDAQAPAVAELEEARHLKGGTALLKAQAICPASAFYQFRLGAGVLEAPVDGLDPRARGSLLHLVFEHFWRGRDSAEVREMTDDLRWAAIDAAVEAGLAEFEQGSEGGSGNGPLPKRFRGIEAARLRRLLGTWLNLDLSRDEDFRVVACEEKHQLCLDGIEASVVIDRIDELLGTTGRDDLPGAGKRLVIDYKTGARVDARSWAAVRITEPQLPIYAAFAVNPHPLAGAAFAQVRSDKMGFVGITETAGVLPKVKSLAESRKRFPESHFADWASLIAHWRQSLLAIAGEIRAGDARVVFADERDLALSPVLPLLRLAERRWQYERLSRGGAVVAAGAGRGPQGDAGIDPATQPGRAINPGGEHA
jgi:exodeoxyribonuclease-5